MSITQPQVFQPLLIDAAPRIVLMRTSRIEANPFQPRLTFKEEEMKDLVASVKEHGILQPILARPKPGDDEWVQIMDGERRFRAGRDAGLEAVPVLVRPATDRQMAELAIIANVSRSDMTPIETARAYRRLIIEFGATVEEVAKKSGRSRPVISNALRLLELPESVIQLIDDGALSDSHGRALAAYKDFPELCAAVGDWAAQTGATSKSLEGGFKAIDYNLRHLLEGKKVVTQLHYAWKETPEFEICAKCPFSAYRHVSNFYHYCLKPSHYDELARAANARREAENSLGTPESIAKKEREAALEAKRAEKQAIAEQQRKFQAETLECKRELAQTELDRRRRYISAEVMEGLRAEIWLMGEKHLTADYNVPILVGALGRWMPSGFDLKKFEHYDTKSDARAALLQTLSTLDWFCLLAEIEIFNDTRGSWCKGERVSAYIPGDDSAFPTL